MLRKTFTTRIRGDFLQISFYTKKELLSSKSLLQREITLDNNSLCFYFLLVTLCCIEARCGFLERGEANTSENTTA